ncbi:MAG: hypothetical protein H7A43_11810 [Verrucomicrobia bacterium]|nr:hypothetical protein [Verrucomicrobiota bacterium]
MKLKDFVAETLNEIVDGVLVAQAHYKEKGGSVNSPDLQFRADQGLQLWDGVTGQPAHNIEFDVAVTTTEGTETKGGVGVFVGPIGLGSQGKSDASNTSCSRIKFSVPVFLPKG